MVDPIGLRPDVNAAIDTTVKIERMRRRVGRGSASATNSGRLKRIWRDERIRHTTRRRRRWPSW